jgi:hypothetical protein
VANGAADQSSIKSDLRLCLELEILTKGRMASFLAGDVDRLSDRPNGLAISTDWSRKSIVNLRVSKLSVA